MRDVLSFLWGFWTFQATVLLVLNTRVYRAQSVLTSRSLCPPILLIPGDGASVLEARFTKPSVPHWFCAKSTHGHWTRVWTPPRSQFLPGRVDCWTDTVRLRVLNETSVENGPGVEIRAIPGEAGLHLKDGRKVDNVYAELLDFLKHTLQCQVVTVATYDFRWSPAGNPAFVEDLIQMIESAFDQAGAIPVTILSHSLGALWTHHLLTQVVDDVWKARYIKDWIPISPAYGGAVLDLQQLISGFDARIPWLHSTDFIDQLRSYETNVWLLPPSQIYGNEPLVRLWTKEDNGSSEDYALTQTFSASNYSVLFQQVHFDTFPILWNRVKSLTLWDNDTDTLLDPGVHVFPIYGTGLETVAAYEYYDTLEGNPTRTTTLDGDSTITLKSLAAGNAWVGSDPLELHGQGHNSILSSQLTWERIQQVLLGVVEEVEDRGAVVESISISDCR